MSDKKTRLIHPQVAKELREKAKRGFGDVITNQLMKTIKERFSNLPLDERHFSLPLFQYQPHAKLHATLPSLSSQKIVEMQVESRYFRWVNHGHTTGIEINKSYGFYLTSEQTDLEDSIRQAKRALFSLNKKKNELKESLKQSETTKDSIKNIEAQVKKCDTDILSFEKYKSDANKQLEITNKLLDIMSYQLFEKKDNFIAITTIPKNISPDPKKVTLTYSFPSTYKRENVTGEKLHPLLVKRLRQSLAANPYINFIEINEEKEGIKASLQIVQRSNAVPEKNGTIEMGRAQLFDAFHARPVSIVLSPSINPKENISTFFHELMHGLGLPHPWHAGAAKDNKGKFKGKLRIHDTIINHPNKKILTEYRNLIETFRKNSNTPFAQTLPDNSNEAYSNVRKINNQDIRALSKAALSVLYHVEDPYPQGVTFKFHPKEIKPDTRVNTVGQTISFLTPEQLEKKEFYNVDVKNQKDGSKLVTYSGRCTGITVSNPGDDFTDLDFRDVPAFPKQPSGFPSGLQQRMTYTKGVTGYFGPDANITFYIYRPSIEDYPGMNPLMFQFSIADNSPEDKNVSIDLSTRNLRRIYLSKHNDMAVISKIYENVEVYPGAGHDMIRVLGNNTTVFIDKYEGYDSLDFEKGGTVKLDYKQDKLQCYEEGDDVYLISIQLKETKSGKTKKVYHGVCLKGYKQSKYKDSIVVKDYWAKTMDLKNKKFAALPSTINFGS